MKNLRTPSCPGVLISDPAFLFPACSRRPLEGDSQPQADFAPRGHSFLVVALDQVSKIRIEKGDLARGNRKQRRLLAGRRRRLIYQDIEVTQIGEAPGPAAASGIAEVGSE